MTTRFKAKDITVIVVVILASLGILTIVGRFTSFGDSIAGFFKNETDAATGPVALYKLQEEDRLEVASGSFEVPVVVCNGKPKTEADRSTMQTLMKSCNGFRDERAILLVRARVPAVIDMSEIEDKDVQVTGKSIHIKLPRPILGDPVVDAEDGIMIISINQSAWPGKLPDDYLSRAAKASKVSVRAVADESGLRKMAERNTEAVFEGLLRSFEFDQVKVTFE